MKLWNFWIRNEKRIYMIPTRFGLALCFLFLFFTVTGAHYSNNLIFLFAFILVSFLLIAILQTAKNLRGLKILQTQISSGFPQEKTLASFYICNARSKDKFGLSLQYKSQREFVIVDEIMPNDSKWIHLPFLLPNKRGRFQTERIKVSTDAPYGLFYGWYYIYRQDSGVVYPAPFGLSREASVPQNTGSDFSGIREYQTGDPLYRISWKHSAKKDQLLVKEFRDESPAIEIYSLSDCTQPDLEGKLSQLSLWICEAEKNQKKYGLILNSDPTTIGHGASHLSNCLYKLGVFQN